MVSGWYFPSLRCDVPRLSSSTSARNEAIGDLSSWTSWREPWWLMGDLLTRIKVAMEITHGISNFAAMRSTPMSSHLGDQQPPYWWLMENTVWPNINMHHSLVGTPSAPRQITLRTGGLPATINSSLLTKVPLKSDKNRQRNRDIHCDFLQQSQVVVILTRKDRYCWGSHHFWRNSNLSDLIGWLINPREVEIDGVNQPSDNHSISCYHSLLIRDEIASA